MQDPGKARGREKSARRRGTSVARSEKGQVATPPHVQLWERRTLRHRWPRKP
jgi:hypothetical protein